MPKHLLCAALLLAFAPMLQAQQSADKPKVKSAKELVDAAPDSAWRTLDPANTKYSWKLFSYRWEGATPGAHVLVSRVTDVEGRVQPTADELKRKKTFLEDNSQFPRKITIS